MKDIEKYREMFMTRGKVISEKKFFEDFDIGEKFVTPAKYITQTELDLFCLITRHSSFHIDAELARSLGFKGKVVPGLFVLSLINGLMGEIGLMEEILLFLGINNTRFRSPVFPGDSVRLQLEVIGKKDVAKWKELGIITFKIEIKNQDEVVVCETEASYQYRRRHPE